MSVCVLVCLYICVGPEQFGKTTGPILMKRNISLTHFKGCAFKFWEMLLHGDIKVAILSERR